MVIDFILYLDLLMVLAERSTHQYSKHVVSSGDRIGAQTLSWGVKLENLPYYDLEYDVYADKLAAEIGLINLGTIAKLPGVYFFAHAIHVNFTENCKHAKSCYVPRFLSPSQSVNDLHHEYPDDVNNSLNKNEFSRFRNSIHERLQLHGGVHWFTQFVHLSRQKRSLRGEAQFLHNENHEYSSRLSINFNDPAFKNQWHLYNHKDRRFDINVTGVWSIYNITGRGVTVCIVDDGVEWKNPDIEPNYVAEASWDLNDGDNDPTPHPSRTTNNHGTRCAGEIVAVPDNGYCGVGVAYSCRLSAIRMIDGSVTDYREAEAFSFKPDINFISSNSNLVIGIKLFIVLLFILPGDGALMTYLESNDHGTRCAGEVSAVSGNKFCGVGVAYNSHVSGIRMLDGPITDGLEATALNYKPQLNLIENLSWGPTDDGKTVDEPHLLAKKSLQRGVELGRNGFGTIYVLPSGNGGAHKDNCNFDGYANSIYTVTISAVDEHGASPFYIETCAPNLASTFSGGDTMFERQITTTDWNSDGGSGCTNRMSGTSASTPIAAGMIALMLEAKPCLSYRDVKHIIILTAKHVYPRHGVWEVNKAGLHHNHYIGFGIMDAFRLVTIAKVWEHYPDMMEYTHQVVSLRKNLPKFPSRFTSTVTVKSYDLNGFNLNVLEYVLVKVDIQLKRRGNLVIYLVCPSGTKSILTSVRPKDSAATGLTGWTLTTVRCWGESPIGAYTLTVIDKDERDEYGTGQFISWQLSLTGSPTSFEKYQQLRRKVEAIVLKGYINESSEEIPCWESPSKPGLGDFEPISKRILKMLALSSIFCIIVAIYEIFEYCCCYREEKAESARKLRLVRRAQKCGLIDIYNIFPSNNEHSNPSCETTRLLSQNDNVEEIALDTFNTTGSNQLGSFDRQLTNNVPELTELRQNYYRNVNHCEKEGERISQQQFTNMPASSNLVKNDSSISQCNIVANSYPSLPTAFKSISCSTEDDKNSNNCDHTAEFGETLESHCLSESREYPTEFRDMIELLPDRNEWLGVDMLHGLSAEEIQLNLGHKS